MSCCYSKVHDTMIPDNTLFPTLEQLAARRNPLSPVTKTEFVQPLGQIYDVCCEFQNLINVISNARSAKERT